MVCNRLPRINEDSSAIWRRVRVINWPVVFKDDIKTETEAIHSKCVKMADHHLQSRVCNWPPYLAGCLVQWLQMGRDEGFDAPSSVKAHTKRFEEVRRGSKRSTMLGLSSERNVSKREKVFASGLNCKSNLDNGI